MLENTAAGTKFAYDFCSEIGPLQLGVVLVLFYYYYWQAWKKCRSRDLGSDKTADFGIKFGENAILVRVSRIHSFIHFDPTVLGLSPFDSMT